MNASIHLQGNILRRKSRNHREVEAQVIGVGTGLEED
jgi:hypothetical protein